MDATQTGIAASTTIGVTSATFSADAYLRNGARTVVSRAEHVPLRASLPVTALGLGAGLLAGAAVASQVDRHDRAAAPWAFLLGGTAAVMGVGLAVACARNAGPVFSPMAELAGFAGPALALAGVGISAGTMLGGAWVEHAAPTRDERERGGRRHDGPGPQRRDRGERTR